MNQLLGNKRTILIFVLPALLIFSCFLILPLIPALVMSFQEHNGFRALGAVGFKNYVSVLTDSTFWRSDLNTLFIVAVSNFIGVPISMALAITIDGKNHFTKKFFKNSSFIPAVLSITVVCQLWIAILHSEWGLLNTLLRSVGLESWCRAWLSDPKTALPAITITYLWQYIGYNMVLFYASLKTIPDKYFEAARLEGASKRQIAWHITVPLMRESLKYVITLSTMGCLSQFANVQIMTKGGPGEASRTLVYHMYHVAFLRSDYGQGCAIAVLITLQGLLASWMINRILNRDRLELS